MCDVASLTSESAATDLATAAVSATAAALAPPAFGLWKAASALLAVQSECPPLVPSTDLPPAPLAFAQERLWWLEQLEPGAPYYTVPLVWEVQGQVNVKALEQSLDFLVQRHEPLRTSYPETPDGPVQRVANWHLPLEVLDLSSQPAGHRLALSHAESLAQAALAVREAPSLRAALYRYGSTQHLFIFVVHQINFDGASMRILSQELAACYRAFVAGAQPQLPPLPVRYSDFARWQHACAESKSSDRCVEFWRSQLQKPYAPLNLPLDHPRRPSGITPGNIMPVHLPAPLIQQLKDQSSALGITPFAALLASFHAFLSRCTGQEDILTLVSVAGRTRPELRNLLGLVANVLPMRSDLSGSPGFNQVMQRTGEMVAAALANQMLPLNRILELMPRPDARSDAPALQVQLLYNNAPLPALRLPAVTFTPSHDVDNGTARFDLSLDLADSPDGIIGHLKYRADLFGQATIQHLLQSWEQFLAQALQDPDKPIQSFSLAPSHTTHSPAIEPESITLKADLRDGLGQSPPPDRPLTTLEQKLTRIWENVFDIRPIARQDNFFGLGGHSLVALKLIAAIGKETGCTPRLHMVFEHPTIERLARAMEEAATPPVSSIVEIQPKGSKPPLFLVHGVGGGMFWGYSNLARHLGSSQPVYAFRSRGMDGREEFARVEEMAAQYVADLVKFKPQGPYLLGGYCFGGNIAYEMARQLTAQNHNVALLLLINCWLNNSSYTRVSFSPSFFALALLNFCRRMEHQIRFGARQPGDFLRWRMIWVWRRLRALASRRLEDRLAVQDIVNLSAQPALEQKLWRTHLQAWLQYQPGPYPGRIVLFRTPGHPLLCSFDSQMGWDAFAAGGVTVHTCPGDHESIMEEENVPYLAAQFKAVLASLPPVSHPDTRLPG